VRTLKIWEKGKACMVNILFIGSVFFVLIMGIIMFIREHRNQNEQYQLSNPTQTIYDNRKTRIARTLFAIRKSILFIFISTAVVCSIDLEILMPYYCFLTFIFYRIQVEKWKENFV